MNKPLMSNRDMIKKIGAMISGMEKHGDENSTVANLRILFSNMIISRMQTNQYLRNGFARMFASDSAKLNEFAFKCLIKALDQHFSDKVKDQALVNLCNSMYISKFGYMSEVQNIVRRLAPLGWVKPDHLKLNP